MCAMWKPPSAEPMSDWEHWLRQLLPKLGHRNWIVVADSAYPDQSRLGIATTTTEDHQVDVIRKVLAAIGASNHIQAKVHIDRELAFVPEGDASGVTAYRHQLDALLKGSNATQLPHEQIIAKLDKSAEVFRILIIKTDMTIPYTSVFFELDCGYWSAEAEERLRKAIQIADSK